MVLLALFFPPLAVGLRRGAGPSFFLCVFLTLCAFVPGVVHALLVIRSPVGMPGARGGASAGGGAGP